MKKAFAFFLVVFALLSSDAALACGSHGACGGGGFGGGFYGGGIPGRGIAPRPLIAGGGAVAFRRANRLARRSNRAAFFGLPGRSARLAFRADAAFNRGAFRNARFNGAFR